MGASSEAGAASCGAAKTASFNSFGCSKPVSKQAARWTLRQRVRARSPSQTWLSTLSCFRIPMTETGSLTMSGSP